MEFTQTLLKRVVKNLEVYRYFHDIGRCFLPILTAFLAICGYHANRNVRILKQTNQTSSFRILCWNRSAAQLMHVPSMKTNGNWKVPSLVNTAGGVAATSQVL